MWRGWLLGWQAGSLTPLGANRSTIRCRRRRMTSFVVDLDGGLRRCGRFCWQPIFVTGNSDPSGTSYNSVTNISETAAKVSPDLTQLLSFFTPSDVGNLDQGDVDFGSGGMLLLPQKGSQPPLAAAAGKEGTLFLMNRNNMGGFSRHRNHVVDSVNIGGCWCGPSYFDAASDSVPRIVASGGNNLTVWKAKVTSGQVGGGRIVVLFTWWSRSWFLHGRLIERKASGCNHLGSRTTGIRARKHHLFAFESEPSSSSYSLQVLYQGTAGTWDSGGGDADLVPVVANGKVYVASYEQSPFLASSVLTQRR